MNRLPPELSSFAWGTAGRPETEAELLFKWRQQRAALPTLTPALKFSLVVPAPSGRLRAAIESQSYTHWELVSDAKSATGDWLMFLDSDDVLSPVALFVVADAIRRRPDAKVVYSHEKTHDGRFFSKAAWSPFSLLHFNAIGGAWWIERRELERLGGITDATDPQSLFLRVDPAATTLVPFFLLYRAKGPALRIGVVESQRARLAPPPERRRVTAIICFRDRAEWTCECLENLRRRSTGVDLEVLLVDNESKPEERRRVEATTRTLGLSAKFLDYPHPFNFAAMHNEAVKSATGDILLLLNNDVFWKKGELAEMAGWASLPWAGTVGMCLRFSDGKIQHAGLRAFFGGAGRLARVSHCQSEDELTPLNREVFGTSFAACAVSKAKFLEIGGLRPRDLPNGFGDVAFGFECRRRGWRNLYLGHLEGTHLESASRGAVYEYWEEIVVEREYPEQLQAMLREDLGFDRVPGQDTSLRGFLRDWALVQAREKFPWLKSLKEKLFSRR